MSSLVENIWKEKLQDEKLPALIHEALLTNAKRQFEPIHEVDEEYASSTLHTGSRTEHLVSNKTGSIMKDGLARSQSKKGKSVNKENLDSVRQSKSNIEISAFDEGPRKSEYYSNQHPGKNVPRGLAVQSEQTPPKTFKVDLNQPADAHDSFKFSFSKVQIDNAGHDRPSHYLSNQTNENSGLQFSNNNITNACRARRNTTKEKNLGHETSAKVTSHIPGIVSLSKEKRLFQSDRINTEKNHKLFTNKVSYKAIPNPKSVFRVKQEAKTKLDHSSHSHLSQLTDKLAPSFAKKSHRDISANSRSSRDSHDNLSQTSRRSKERNYRSYLDLQPASQNFTVPKSLIFKHNFI